MSSINSGVKSSLAENWTRTKIEVHTVTHIWTIDNFHFLEVEGGDVKSSAFSAATNDKIAFKLLLKPNEKFNGNDVISLYLCLSPNLKLIKVFANFTASVLNDKEEKVSTKCTTVFDMATDDYGLKQFCIKDDYFRTNFLHNNKLTIYCKVEFSTVRDVLVNSFKKKSSKSIVNECNLSENFASLLETRAFSDVVLSTKKKDFPAHKLILAARSKVFAAMFQHDMKENRVNRIDIEDMSEEVVSEMLQYIYTGKCEKSDKLAASLLAAADKYDLDGLTKMCSDALYKTLSVENATSILILADMYNAIELKNEVIEVIVARLSEVLDTADWKNVLMNPRLTNEVFRAVARR